MPYSRSSEHHLLSPASPPWATTDLSLPPVCQRLSKQLTSISRSRSTIRNLWTLRVGDGRPRCESPRDSHQPTPFVTNSFFKKPRSRYWTWESPGGDYKNQIDFILTTDKTTIQNTEIITKVDIGSDHRMVRSRMTINKKLTRLKRIKKKKPLKINTRQLEKVAPSFQIKLKNKFDILRNEKPSIEVMNETIRKCAAEVVEKPNETKKEQNAEDKLIEELEQRRKELRRKDNKTGPERVEYIETNKTVKKKRRARARRKRKEFITKILEQKRGPKETNKYGNKKKIAKMKDKEGRETSDREEILEICKSFYATLYENTIQSPTNLQRESADKDEVPPFTVDEVRKCLKEMSKNKAPGPDDITSDVLLLGEEPVLKYLTSCYNKILKTKEIPPSWDEAKIIILYKKGDPGDVKNYRPISLLSHSYKLFTRLLQKRMENTLDENQPRDQAGFRRGFSTTDHIFTLNQVIEKSNEYNLPLCVGFIDYEKAFDSVEHFAIFSTRCGKLTSMKHTLPSSKTSTKRLQHEFISTIWSQKHSP
ncbi:hypothetical protein RRG08_011097 [Elysia crispata]|uniref:Reverse transcriptase domain-containing protein n=1 Tax=Elysia crispata TaxID=231223 RepID=A0AAE1AN82_9GAST|nr:hypothetical protein RRG08_011097 [Elysia crispata]